MANTGSFHLATRYYRIRSPGPHDGATCFLRPAQALGHEVPDPVPAYLNPGRACRPVQVPLDDILAFEEV